MAIGPPVLVALARGELDAVRSMIDEFERVHARSGAAFESDYRSVFTVALAHLEEAPNRALAAIVDAGSGDYAEWPAWLPFAVDLLVDSNDYGALTMALKALEGPVAPKTSPYVTGQARRIAAHLASRAGDSDAASEYWRKARQLMSKAGVVFDAAVLAIELAEAGADMHVDERAVRGDALATFERLQARPWVERARRGAARSIR
jgi:hypothetical protein